MPWSSELDSLSTTAYLIPFRTGHTRRSPKTGFSVTSVAPAFKLTHYPHAPRIAAFTVRVGSLFLREPKGTDVRSATSELRLLSMLEECVIVDALIDIRFGDDTASKIRHLKSNRNSVKPQTHKNPHQSSRFACPHLPSNPL